MARIAIIQVSDMQFGPKCLFQPQELARGIAADVHELAGKHAFVPLYLLVSGDIAETGTVHEFELGRIMIDALVEELSIDRQSVMVVPGNHDICWELSKLSVRVGDPRLKYSCYDKFCEELFGDLRCRDLDLYPVFSDQRNGILFLLLNSCESEDHDNHVGSIDTAKLLRSLETPEAKSAECSDFLKIAVLHHRLDVAAHEDRSSISNAADVDAILSAHDFQIVLTGHVHSEFTHCTEVDRKRVVYSGCGSTAIDKTQRPDGIPNQYTVHVLDDQSPNPRIESFFRAYNPRKRTRAGLGGWTRDSTYEESPQSYELSWNHRKVLTPNLMIEDNKLFEILRISKNPFAVSNAEKISNDVISKLFVQDEERHRSALRLSGDAIVRGKRGSGKTMCLKYLNLFGEYHFRKAIRDRKTAECFPVFVNLGQLHVSDCDGNLDEIFDAAEQMIVEQTVDGLSRTSQEIQSAEFKAALHKCLQRHSILQNQSGSKISHLGQAISETLNRYFDHVLLLIDEIAPVFPKMFFADAERGYGKWMNSIRNSGPFNTRIAVYPNDVADTLNEERFGTVVNLEFHPRERVEFEAFRGYAIKLFNQYIESVAADKDKSPTIESVLEIGSLVAGDALEQLLYASNGSSRRLVRLFEKCLTHRCSQGDQLSKEDVFEVIREFSENLLAGYSTTEQQLANSLAKACKRAGTFRFRCPGLSESIKRICFSREETNLVALIEAGSGTRATAYEFNYPHCVQMGIPTHHLKETTRIHHGRDVLEGEWIQRITGLEKDQLDVFTDQVRLIGTVVEVADEFVLLLTKEKVEFFVEDSELALKVGDQVSFVAIDSAANDILVI